LLKEELSMRFALLIVTTLLIAVTPAHAGGGKKVSIALNWVPEPEFGGIYEASRGGAFGRQGINATIQPGGAGAPTWQLVASGKADFAVASADEIVIARAHDANILGIFAIYQTCPQGLMTHASRGFKKIDDVFSNPGTIAMEIGLSYGKFLQKKFGFDKVKRVAYDGGIGNFLADANFSQQCFVFSEPLAAKKAGADPQVFLIADAGYNPYTGVIITTDKMLRDSPDVTRAVVAALAEGWASYLKDPKLANEVMGKLNKTMDAETFAAAAEAQKALIESEDTRKNRLGWMMPARWEELCKQLADLKVVEKSPPALDCFKNVPMETLR
jgi:NitT/TauT family transport system substrate-binding protein